MKKEDEKILYLGFDESNHGKWPEIIVCTSSIIKGDAMMKFTRGKKRMTEWELIKYFINRNRDFAYTEVEERQIEKSESALIKSIPYLVNSLVGRLARDKIIDSAKLIIDGESKPKEIKRLNESVKLIKDLTNIKEVGYKFFPKSNMYYYKYSPILEVADSLAHHFFKGSSLIKKINAPDRMIELNT